VSNGYFCGMAAIQMMGWRTMLRSRENQNAFLGTLRPSVKRARRESRAWQARSIHSALSSLGKSSRSGVRQWRTNADAGGSLASAENLLEPSIQFAKTRADLRRNQCIDAGLKELGSRLGRRKRPPER
jgi:hypothetical protein